MALGLDQHALARIDQDHGQVGAGGAGRHIAGELLVARRIGDNEAAAWGGEKPVGDVDGDTLLALGLQPVDQQRQIDVLAGRAVFRRITRNRGQLIVVDQLGIVEQASDQGRLAVVYRSAGQKSQQAAIFAGWQVESHPSKIALLLLLLHRSGLVAVDQPPLSL